MELRQLAAFAAVADELHFGRAAERLGIVQPAVSQLVRRLERELGIVLFERSSHRVALTGAGARLLPAAKRALAASHELAAEAGGIVRGEQGELRIGTSEGIAANLNLLLGRFADERPKVSSRLTAIHTPGKLDALRHGDLDVAFVRAPVDTRGLRTAELWCEPLRAVLPARHPVARQPTVSLAELSALPLLLSPRSVNPGVHEELLALCRRSGLEPQLGPPLSSPQDALATISTGKAWTMLTLANAPREGAGLAVRTIDAPAARATVSLAWRATGTGSLARTFIDLCLRARDHGELGAPAGAA